MKNNYSRNILYSELAYMLKNLPIEKKLMGKLQSLQLIFSNITDDEICFLRDLCGERLQKHGFDESYKTTSEGEMLENLIDKLYRG